MDGLLIDSEPFWRASHVSSVLKHGGRITEDDVRKMAGKRIDEVVNYWHQTQPLRVSSYDLEADITKEVIYNIRLNGKELPGVRKIISILEGHNVPLALASSSSPEIIEATIKKLKLRNHFCITYSAKHEKFGKPHPGVFLTTAKKLGVHPSSCIVFEDAISGIRAAKSAGMKCIAVPDNINLKKPEFADEADAMVSSLEQVQWQDIIELFKD